MNKDLIYIKDKYGEKMMHLCRKHFSTILEEEGKMFKLLSDNFAYSKFLYYDIIDNSLEDAFVNHVYGLLEPVGELPIVSESVRELFDGCGYDFYECHTCEEVNSFSRYYFPSEKICTFRKNRLEKCHVFFAVKKNVSEIKREDFLYPQRQDKYGTSVISIQFTRGDNNILSIKNRYNHSVTNPDATYSNNLENIVPGLTKSFERDYGLNINQNKGGDFEIPGYIKANDGRFYKYNYEINGVYYCDNNIIIDDMEVITDYCDKEKYIVMDYFIIDLVNKKIRLYDNSINDSFISNLSNIKKININKIKGTRDRIIDIIFNDDTKVIITIDKFNRMKSYKNDNILEIGDNFLNYNKYLEMIDISNVKKIGNGFLYVNNVITSLNFPNLLEVKDNFLTMNTVINSLCMDNVMKIGNNFLKENKVLTRIFMPMLLFVGDGFISKNKIIKELIMYNLVYAGNYFLQCNTDLLELYFPRLKCVGNWFVSANKIVNKIDFSLLEEVGDNFLASNNTLIELVMLCLEKVGNNFLFRNRCIQRIDTPRLKYIGKKFLYYNNSLLEMYVDCLEYVGDYFLYMNTVLKNDAFSLLKGYGKNNISVKKRVLIC